MKAFLKGYFKEYADFSLTIVDVSFQAIAGNSTYRFFGGYL